MLGLLRIAKRRRSGDDGTGPERADHRARDMVLTTRTCCGSCSHLRSLNARRSALNVPCTVDVFVPQRPCPSAHLSARSRSPYAHWQPSVHSARKCCRPQSPEACARRTSGSLAKRSTQSTFRRPSPGLAELREEARSAPISMHISMHTSRCSVSRHSADTERKNRACGNPRTRS